MTERKALFQIKLAFSIYLGNQLTFFLLLNFKTFKLCHMDRCCKYALFKLYWGLLNNLTYFTFTCYTHEPIEGCTENVNSMNNFRAKYSY